VYRTLVTRKKIFVISGRSTQKTGFRTRPTPRVLAGISESQELPPPLAIGIPTSQLPDFRTSGLSVFRTSGLPDFPTSRLPDFRTSGLPDFRTSRLPDFPTSRLPDFRTASRSNCYCYCHCHFPLTTHHSPLHHYTFPLPISFTA